MRGIVLPVLVGCGRCNWPQPAGPPFRGSARKADLRRRSSRRCTRTRAGFVWIGSRDGLTLYDGYSFVVFEHDATDPTSFSGNTIRTIYEDRDDNLWFGTNTGGLNRLDRSSLTFEHFRHDSADPRSISHDSVYAVLHDRDGLLWVGTQRGLNRLNTETGEFERFFADPDDPGSLSNDYIMTLLQDRAGRVWIGTLGRRIEPVASRDRDVHGLSARSRRSRLSADRRGQRATRGRIGTAVGGHDRGPQPVRSAGGFRPSGWATGRKDSPTRS